MIDLRQLGRDHVIGAWELAGGRIVDPGPASRLETLLDGLGEEPTALLLTHIHLDHAGAAGSLCERFPTLRVYVHETGAPHLVDPSKLVGSAARLYGDRMDELWGEVVPVPGDRITELRGGEEAEGLRVEHAPGHAIHHVVYFDEAERAAYTGDAAGVRVPPSDLAVAPTPPPEIDVEAWERTFDMLDALGAETLHLTHFGLVDDPAAQIAGARQWLAQASALARDGGDLEAWIWERRREVTGDVSAALEEAAPAEHLRLGLERYWRKRAEAEAA